MVTYLNYRDSNYKKSSYWGKFALEPSYFQSEVGSNNTFTLKLPLVITTRKLVYPFSPIPPTLPLGDYVSLADTEYGGKITSYDIDIKNKIVTYYGDSLRGILGKWIAEPGVADAEIQIYENAQHGTDSTHRKSLEDYLTHRASLYGIPIEVTQVDRIPSSYFTLGSAGNLYLKFTIPLGTTFLEACELFAQNTGLKYKITWTSNGTMQLKFRVRQTLEYNYLDERKDLIITQTLKQNMVVDRSTMHYIANDDTYKSQAIDWNGGNPPADLKYPGLGIYSVWNPNSESNKENQNQLQALREKGAGCSITLTEDDINADIGDYLTVVARQIGIRTEPQKISGKVLTIENGRSKVEYILS